MGEKEELRYNQKVYYLDDVSQIIEANITSARDNGKQIEVYNGKNRFWMLSKDVSLDKQVLIDFIGDNGFRI